MHQRNFLYFFKTFFNSIANFFGVRPEENPAYTIIHKTNNKEIREYYPYIKASVTVAGLYDDAVKRAFKKLAAYIFGQNKTKMPMSMTAPVLIEHESELIPMTAPVLINNQEKGFLTMSFIMPAKYTLEHLPRPSDPTISFEKTQTTIFAVIRFSGRARITMQQEQKEALMNWVNTLGDYEANGPSLFAGYDPPWTISFLRRNEIMIPLRRLYKSRSKFI